MFEMIRYREQDEGLFPKGVDLRCECTAFAFEPLDKFETINDKYAVLKDDVIITCPICGKSQSAPDKYIPKETQIPASMVRHSPECPVCHSLDVEKIGAIKKYSSFAVMGVFSPNLGKQFHCRSCGYRF